MKLNVKNVWNVDNWKIPPEISDTNNENDEEFRTSEK